MKLQQKIQNANMKIIGFFLFIIIGATLTSNFYLYSETFFIQVFGTTTGILVAGFVSLVLGAFVGGAITGIITQLIFTYLMDN